MNHKLWFIILFSVNIEVSIEVCSDSVHCFRKFMASTEEKSINKLLVYNL